MSVINFLKDVFTGNETNALARLKDWWSGVSPGVQAEITTLETGEGKILSSVAVIGAKDVIAGGFSTASFVAAVKDIGAQLLAQNITLAQTTIFVALNAEVGHQAAAAGIPVPTNAGVAVIPPVEVVTP